MDSILSTVGTIFKERYGVNLKIERKEGRHPYFLSQWQSPFVYSRSLREVSFPIFNSKRELQAIATASPVQNQDAVIFDEMGQFLQLTIAEHIELTDRASHQLRVEEIMEKSLSNPGKVVNLVTRSKNAPTSIQYKKIKPKREPDLRPIWISGDNMSFNSHIAFCAHEWINNWAFINAKEIPDLIWKDPNAWQNFPQVTIFIPNLSSLSAENIAILQKNMETLSKVRGAKPMIIVTSQSKVSDELQAIKRYFKHYKASDKVTARVQSHFLLFNYKSSNPWSHNCNKVNETFYLPLSPNPKNVH